MKFSIEMKLQSKQHLGEVGGGEEVEQEFSSQFVNWFFHLTVVCVN